MVAADTLKQGLQALKIGIFVAAEGEKFHKAQFAAPPVEPNDANGNASAQRHLVKTAAPARGPLAGALGRQPEPQQQRGRDAQPTGDIVAVSVHEHQVYVHDVLAAANQTARLSLARWPATREILQLPADAPLAGSTLVSLTSEADKVIAALLCRDEPALPGEGLRGDGDFEKSYAQGRRPDPQGRALRDLDLKTRLFRYRCSPLIYSESFRGFPPELRTLVLTRLASVLRAEQTPAEYAYLPAAERQAIDEILTATLPDLPAGWRRK